MVERQIALVTGASSGIGFAIAALLAARGYHTFGSSRDAVLKGPKGVEMLQLDVTSDESARATVKEVASRAGHIDILVNNAGYGLFGGVEETSMDEAKAQLETNFWGAVRMTGSRLAGHAPETLRSHHQHQLGLGLHGHPIPCFLCRLQACPRRLF